MLCECEKYMNNSFDFAFPLCQVFKRAYIPRTLNEVKHYERDMDLIMKLKEEDMAVNAQQDNVSRLVGVQQAALQKQQGTVPNLFGPFKFP